MELHPIATTKYVQDRPQDGWLEWHKRYGHVAYSGLQRLNRESLVDGMTIDENSPMPQCEACIQAKQTCDPFPSATENRSETLGELTHSDVWGPAPTDSVGGSRYFISFIDDCSRRCNIEFMKKKSQTMEKVMQYITHLKNRWDSKRPKFLRVNNGTEYINEGLMTWCKNQGIELQRTAPYSPEQNGAPERLNRTLIELARAMIIE
jgi:transposase InsO family protein